MTERSGVVVRLRVVLRGAVQGVGFRPFVYRLARELGLAGWVMNEPSGVRLEVEGPPPALEAFLVRLPADRPPRASIQSLEPWWLDPVGYTGFEIRPSDDAGPRRALALPDIATCEACRLEIFDPADRRWRYPFTNCTHCGPRYSILEGLPYDRARTSMKAFTMCDRCRAEYDDPEDRRFHAQPNACPICGPRLELWGEGGRVMERDDDALRAAAAAVRDGRILAMKGLGGFHLIVDARNGEAVRRLRERKHREEKPLAVMAPALEAAHALVELAPLEERLISGPEAPILLARARIGGGLAPEVAPRNPYLGVMLPYTPLHLLLLTDLGFPVVATSGNRSDEPICVDEREALERLGGIADLFLVHDRPIVHHVDDSIVRVQRGRELVLRRARGYAPWPVPRGAAGPPLLALGGHLKNSVTLAIGSDYFVGPHVGDLDNERAIDAFRRTARGLGRLYEVEPEAVAIDCHPDYVSSREGRAMGATVEALQHHEAHVAAAMAENELTGPVLGVSWDGTGYGLDGTIWGGEFFVGDGVEFERVASLRPFRLPGGEAAVREPRRSALGLLYECWCHCPPEADSSLPPLAEFTGAERAVLWRMLEQGINAPVTTSAGRLFDGVASLLGLRQVSRFEGQAAMELEFAAEMAEPAVVPYPFGMMDGTGNRLLRLDWEPALRGLLAERAAGASPAGPARRFHVTLAEMIVAVARRIGLPRVVLSGGCFQNRLLTEETAGRLEAAGYCACTHQRVPPGDGGLSLGQAAMASHRLARRVADVPRGSR